MADIDIEIDGNVVKAKAGEMLIAVTDREGISVPRFCYHKKLSVAASCRMCLVDVEGAPKPQPACSTPINEGMKVHTQNAKAKASQQAVMEFLLINHPLDCPICDQGGECELQDVAMDYGSDVSRFTEGKRVVVDSDIGPLIQTDMTRCIHCTRCVRFGSEIAGIMEMGGTGRGEDLKIEPFLAEGIQSELSGNMIDVCPVGALTSKPFRYELRSWQMSAVAGIARHDLVGSNLLMQTYKGKIKRIVSADNDAVNETWIADRDRFSYEGLAHKNRLLKAQIKVEGAWQEVDWQVALNYAVRGLKNNVLNSRQFDKLGALASKTATLEEFYLLKKLLAKIGTNNVDYRLNIKNLAQSIELESTIKLVGLEQVDYALIVGSNLRLEQPMINHRLRKAVLKGGDVDTINVMTFDFNYPLNVDNITAPNQIAQILAGVLKTILIHKQLALPDYLNNVEINAVSTNIAQKLLNAHSAVMILGEHIVNNENSATIANLIKEIATNTGGNTLNITQSANALGANLAGFMPSNDGLDANAMLDAELRAYILLDVYPEFDCHDAGKMINTLNREDVFVIALNSFKDETIAKYADVLLPIANFYESAGTHVNIDTKAQSCVAAVQAPGEAKPAWKVLKVLADLLTLTGFHYVDSTQVLNDILHTSNKTHEHHQSIDLVNNNDANISTIWQNTPYVGDALLRHSASLQQTQQGQINVAYMNQSSAKSLELSINDRYLGVPVVVTDAVADKCVFVHTHQVSPIGEQT